MRRLILTFGFAVLAGTARAQINFEPPATLMGGDEDCLQVFELQVEDLDADGLADILYGGCPTDGSAPVQVRLNRGPAGFIAAPSLASMPRLVDLDGDGLLDALLLAVEPSGLRVLHARRGLGDGSFDVPQVLTLPEPSAQTTLHVGDIDGDGDADILSVVPGLVQAHRNDAGVLTSLTPFALPADARPGTVLDLDGDGRLDLYDPNIPAIGFLSGTGDGRFESATPPLVTDNFPRLVGMDWDADGDTDLLVIEVISISQVPFFDPWSVPSPPTMVITAYRREADRSLTRMQSLEVPANEFLLDGLASGRVIDLDGDGRPAVVATAGNGGCPLGFSCPDIVMPPSRFGYLAVNTDGTPSLGAVYTGGHFGIGDVDGDGRPDALGMSAGLVWRRGVVTPNSAPAAPARVDMVSPADTTQPGIIHIQVADADEQVPTLRVVSGPLRARAGVYCQGTACAYYRGQQFVSGGADRFTILVTDLAGGETTVEVSVRIAPSSVLPGGGGSPDPLTLAGLLLAAGWSARRRLLRA